MGAAHKPRSSIVGYDIELQRDTDLAAPSTVSDRTAVQPRR